MEIEKQRSAGLNWHPGGKRLSCARPLLSFLSYYDLGGSHALYRDHIYPFLVSKLGDPEPIRQVRQQIIASAQGKVLEIGIGAGANLAHYDPARVSKLYALEPNRTMIRLSERRRKQTKLEIEFLDLAWGHIPLGDGTIDTVVSTFTLCTIPDVAE